MVPRWESEYVVTRLRISTGQNCEKPLVSTNAIAARTGRLWMKTGITYQAKYSEEASRMTSEPKAEVCTTRSNVMYASKARWSIAIMRYSEIQIDGVWVA